MIKKISAFMLILALVFALGACTAKEKEDVANVEDDVKGDIATIVADAKTEWTKVEGLFGTVKTEAATLEADADAEIHKGVAALETDVANVKAALDEDEAVVADKVNEATATLKTDLSKVKADAETLESDASAEIHKAIADIEASVASLEAAFKK